MPLLADLNILLGTLDNNAYTCSSLPGASISSNKRYWIQNYHLGCAPGILGAHDAEDNEHYYRTLKSDDLKLPENHWQFVPVLNLLPNQGGNHTGFPLNVFAICERRYGKFLAYYMNRGEVQMRGPLSMVNLSIDNQDGYYFDVDFEQRTWEANPGPHPQFVFKNSKFRTSMDVSRLGWTPYFAIIPGSHLGYFYITPFTPQSAFSSDLTPGLYGTMTDEGPFISADSDCNGKRIWTLNGHRPDSMDEWRFDEVDV